MVTNSLEATDVAVVHSGYAHWRQPLLAAGVDLHELKRAAALPPVRERGMMGMGSSSTSSLHAKVFLMDRRHVFVGSFNFDPRSADLNTEMGFVIDSPALAGQMQRALRERVPARAYKVELDKAGALHWIEQRPSGPVTHDTEPGTSFWQRSAVGVLSLLPIDWLL